MKPHEKELLQEELRLLQDAKKILEYSYHECQRIGIKESYTFEELDKFEALTSRFARTSDVLIQKTFRLIDRIELESPGSVIDRIHRAERRSLISSADLFKEIRRIRNDIDHEYIPGIIELIFEKVLQLTPQLIDSIERVERYCDKYCK
ncbi:MAG: hypothetical protein GX962_05185 [Epulopiscium sp.]|nr:hypothetical protein [Candidatus Epulonipiscium sp.]